MAPAAPPGPPPPNRTRTILSRPASRNNRRSRPSAAPSRRRNSSRCRDRTYGCGGAHPLWSCRSGSSAPCTGSVLAGTNARSRRPPCGTAPTATRPTGCWYSASAQNRACRRKRSCQGCRYRRRTPADGVQSAARDTPRHDVCDPLCRPRRARRGAASHPRARAASHRRRCHGDRESARYRSCGRSFPASRPWS